ncbi:MAG: oligosaccharide flippase family protein, partial [Bryobacteraceae bacterium]
MRRIVQPLLAVVSGRGNSAAAIQSLLTKVLVLGINAATSVVVARVLRPAGRGEMSALMIWAGFIGAMLTVGLPSAVVFNLRRKPEDSSTLIGASLILSLAVSVLICLIGELLVPSWLRQYPAYDVVWARWFLLSAPISILLPVLRAAMEASGRFSSSNAVLWSGPFLT